MIEVFYEQTVTPKDGAKAQSGFKKMRFLSWITLFSAIFSLLLLYITYISLEVTDGNILNAFLTGILPLLIITIIFFVLYGVFRSKKHNYLIDYDYTFVSGELRIAKVLNGIKRKAVAKISCSNISVVGKVNTDKYLRYKTMPNIKKIIASPNLTENENLYFAYCTNLGQPSLLLFEPTTELLINIKKFASRTIEWI